MWLNGNSAWCDDVNTEEIETLEDNIAGAFKDAVTTLTERYGNDLDDWQWSKVHGLVLEHRGQLINIPII